jgi:hypothetical protein
VQDARHDQALACTRIFSLQLAVPLLADVVAIGVADVAQSEPIAPAAVRDVPAQAEVREVRGRVAPERVVHALVREERLEWVERHACVWVVWVRDPARPRGGERSAGGRGVRREEGRRHPERVRRTHAREVQEHDARADLPGVRGRPERGERDGGRRVEGVERLPELDGVDCVGERA